LDSISSRYHVWLNPENQQKKYEEMAQEQLPIGWHAWKVESKKKIHRTIHELSYFNKTINNEVNEIADRCLHCGTTLHWHLKISQCPLYDKNDECKIHGIFQRKSNREIKLLIKNLKNLNEEQRKQRQNSNKKVYEEYQVVHLSKNDRKTNILDAVYEDADSHWKSQNAESTTKIVESTIAETTSEVNIFHRNEHLTTASVGYSYLDNGIPINNQWLYESDTLTKEDEKGYPFAEAQAKLEKYL